MHTSLWPYRPCRLALIAALASYTEAHVKHDASPTTLRVDRRNIIIVGGDSASNGTSSPLPSSSAAATNSTGTAPTTASGTQNTSIPTYALDIPSSSGSSQLKYLYFFFLIIGLVIVGLVARIIIVKRRRERKQQKASVVRSEALRRDMESRANGSPNVEENGEMVQRTTSNGSHWQPPPPPYPNPMAQAQVHEQRLPYYDDLAQRRGQLEPLSEEGETGSISPPASVVYRPANATDEPLELSEHDTDYALGTSPEGSDSPMVERS